MRHCVSPLNNGLEIELVGPLLKMIPQYLVFGRNDEGVERPITGQASYHGLHALSSAIAGCKSVGRRVPRLASTMHLNHC